MSELMSDAQLRRRKKLQSESYKVTGTLGLASLGAFAASKAPGAKVLTKTPKLRRLAAGVNTKKLKDASLGLSVTSGGIGGVSAFNSAKISDTEARRRNMNQPVKKNDPFNISKLGDWKTIDQREQSQRRSRKAMRGAGAAAGTGAALTAVGFHEGGDKKVYERGYKTAQGINRFRQARNHLDGITGPGKSAKRTAKTNLTALKGIGGAAKSTYKGLSLAGKAGTGLLGASAVVGGGAKAKHTYDQHKINQRRRARVGKSGSVSAFGITHD